MASMSAAAQRGGSLDQIHSILARPDTLCGKFEQAKTLVGLKNPVKSSGRFCVVVNKGVLWRTLEPFPSSLRLTRNELVEMQGDRITTRMSADAEPAVRVINDLLFSLLAGDMKGLTTTFEIDATADRAAWQAVLVPRDGGMKKVIRGIDVNGGEYVNHIVIREAGGDRTDISFSAIATGSGAMQPGEAKLFG